MREFDPRAIGLYVVTSATHGAGRGHRDVADAAIAGGATAVQLRAPELDDGELAALAVELAARCRDADVLFIVNDRVDVAIATPQAGAHLGQADDPDRARQKLGDDRVLGISVGDVRQARRAAEAGADYLGVTVWRTRTKPEATPLGLDGLAEIVRASGLPVVGIGGIGAGNAAEVVRAGAAGIAVVSAVGEAVDPVGATKELRAIVDRVRGEGEVA